MKNTLIFSLTVFVILLILLSMVFSSVKKTITPINKPPLPTFTLTPSPRPKPLEVRSSIPYWDQKKAFASFSQNAGVFSHLSLFWYFLGEDGTVNKYRYANTDKNIIDIARKNNVQVTAVITNLPESGGWDSDRVEYILDDKAAREQLIQEISDLLTEMEFDGVTVDFEEIIKEERNNFSEFIKKLTEKLHQNGKIVQVALHPKSGDERNDSRYDYQDWRAISDYADQVYIMAYGEHYDEGPPGPVASVPWVDKIIKYTKSFDLPLHKFYLGIPLYGYDWAEGNDQAAGLTWQQVENLLAKLQIVPKFDDDAQTPYFEYIEKSVSHEVWYEDQKSIAAKVSLADKAGFAGVTFWRLGGEDPKVWDLFRK